MNCQFDDLGLSNYSLNDEILLLKKSVVKIRLNSFRSPGHLLQHSCAMVCAVR